MSNSVIQSILARCIVDPPFLDRLVVAPLEALHGYDLDHKTRAQFAELDVHRLRGFAGLVTRVQNNGLWQDFSATRSLLVHHGLDLEVFAAYCPQHQHTRSEGKLGRDEQTRRFLAFLHDWIAPREIPCLADVLAHETFVWDVRRSFAGAPPSSPHATGLPAARLADLVPAVQGVLRVRAFLHDPAAIVRALEAGTYTPERLSHRLRWLAYWGDAATGTLRVLELDMPIAHLLEDIDGRRNLRTLARRASRRAALALAPAHFRPFLANAVSTGLLSVR
jgi:hypothetical protein